jgi:hypothetical protein
MQAQTLRDSVACAQRPAISRLNPHHSLKKLCAFTVSNSTPLPLDCCSNIEAHREASGSILRRQINPGGRGDCPAKVILRRRSNMHCLSRAAQVTPFCGQDSPQTTIMRNLSRDQSGSPVLGFRCICTYPLKSLALRGLSLLSDGSPKNRERTLKDKERNLILTSGEWGGIIDSANLLPEVWQV